MEVKQKDFLPKRKLFARLHELIGKLEPKEQAFNLFLNSARFHHLGYHKHPGHTLCILLGKTFHYPPYELQEFCPVPTHNDWFSHQASFHSAAYSASQDSLKCWEKTVTSYSSYSIFDLVIRSITTQNAFLSNQGQTWSLCLPTTDSYWAHGLWPRWQVPSPRCQLL